MSATLESLRHLLGSLERAPDHGIPVERWAGLLLASDPAAYRHARAEPEPLTATSREERVSCLERRAAQGQALFNAADAFRIPDRWEARSQKTATRPRGSSPARTAHRPPAPLIVRGAARETSPDPLQETTMPSVKQLESAEQKKAARKEKATAALEKAKAAYDQARQEHREAKEALSAARAEARKAGNGKAPKPAGNGKAKGGKKAGPTTAGPSAEEE